MVSDLTQLSPEALYISLVESLPLSIFQKDRQFRILFGNQRFCEGLGLRFVAKWTSICFPPNWLRNIVATTFV